FGVRRPLRFLAYKLGLEETQVSELAKILDEIKTERAQAAVDHRRALSAFAEAVSGGRLAGGRTGAAAPQPAREAGLPDSDGHANDLTTGDRKGRPSAVGAGGPRPRPLHRE